MKTEREKMLAGEPYDALDPELVAARERARDLCHDLNATREREQDIRRGILTELFGSGGDSVWMQPTLVFRPERRCTDSSGTAGRRLIPAAGRSAPGE